jgi:hypothetical protein
MFAISLLLKGVQIPLEIIFLIGKKVYNYYTSPDKICECNADSMCICKRLQEIKEQQDKLYQELVTAHIEYVETNANNKSSKEI